MNHHSLAVHKHDKKDERLDLFDKLNWFQKYRLNTKFLAQFIENSKHQIHSQRYSCNKYMYFISHIQIIYNHEIHVCYKNVCFLHGISDYFALLLIQRLL